MDITFIKARDIPDLWFQAVNKILDEGKHFKIDKGSYEGQTRLEFDYFIGHILNPAFGSGTTEILPQIPTNIGIPNPVELDYVYGGPKYSRSYVEYLMTDVVEPNEQYTYGERLYNYNYMHAPFAKSQVDYVINTYKSFGHRNNQMILQIGQPSDIELTDPPCLRHIDTRIQNNKLHFFIYFRSWDLWGGMPANLAGIEALHQYMAGEIGVTQGEFIVESKGLHLYGYAEELAKLRCLK